MLCKEELKKMPNCLAEHKSKNNAEPKNELGPASRWRRCGDLNPSAGRTDLPDFESGPFNHLGTSPYMLTRFREVNALFSYLILLEFSLELSLSLIHI